MSGEEKPEELPAFADLADAKHRAEWQVQGTDVVRSGLAGGIAPFGLVPHDTRAYQYGKASNFEDHELNTMLDMVEDTKPSDLEEAARALRKAGKAINEAAVELRKNIRHANEGWEGEAGRAFEKWGKKLAGTTEVFASFVQMASIETEAAGIGLASVKSSLPPRDNRLIQKKPSAFISPEQTDSNADYTAAKKVEKDRQEAINQMNRLASFYSVSAQGLNTLKSQEPTFEMMPNVGVPRPEGDGWGGSGSGESAVPTGDSSAGRRDVPLYTTGSVATPESLVADARGTDEPVNLDRRVGTELDSVNTLPPTAKDPPVAPQPSPIAPGGGNNQSIVPPYPTGGLSPVRTSPPPTAKGYGTGSGKTPSTMGQGRPTSTSPGNRSTTNTPMGRQTSTGQSPGRGAGGGRQVPMGRAISGGTPRPNSPSSGRGNAWGNPAANRDGVTGGRQSATSSNRGQEGRNGARGTVVGNETSADSRSGAGRVAQRGVVGGPAAGTSGARTSTGGRRVQGASEAVTGKPAARNAGGRSGRQGFTSGGSGLARPGEGSREEETEEGGSRPDYLVEDPETHTPDRPRPNVPPVIN
ncbi:hypothetical protein [Streptomyces sp. SCSIO ZS0520]|uniref:hypothetical protein n=1 Tax=Streptomyces sp. SCSIO ZS0520 TaxID=2892996 RepID=UPI0021D80302|nr:hypothetical protein [Streptomyces sp. SCSIO ZS0520]